MTVLSTIILAAGESTRFPNNKLLQKIDVEGREYTIIEYLIQKYINTPGISEIVLVVGYNKEEFIENTGYYEVKYVYNPGYREGMSSSVKAGVRSVIRYADIVAIHPGDVPFIRLDTLNTLVDRSLKLYKTNKPFILLPSYKGVKGGHPLIISRHLLPYVLEIGEETRGLKGFLKRFSNKKVYVETSDLGVVYDIDTPDDLVRAESLFNIKWVRF